MGNLKVTRSASFQREHARLVALNTADEATRQAQRRAIVLSSALEGLARVRTTGLDDAAWWKGRMEALWEVSAELEEDVSRVVLAAEQAGV